MIKKRFKLDNKDTLKIDFLLDEDRIINLSSIDKTDVIKELLNTLNDPEVFLDYEVVLHELIERENLITTGIGVGIAVPHIRSKHVFRNAISIGVSHTGIDWQSFDLMPVKIVILILGKALSHDEFLFILSKLTTILKEATNREYILNATHPEDIYQLFVNQGLRRS